MLHPIHRAIILLTAARAMRCPHTQLRLRLGAAEIRDTAAALVSGLEAAATDIESGNAQDALAAWTRATDAVAVGSAEVCLPALVATDAAARDAGAAAKRSIIDAFGTCYGRKALYDAIKASETTDPLLARARDKHVARFEANGLALADAAAREQVAKLKLELGAECAAMEQEINGDSSTVALTRDELEGVPAALVDALPVGDGDKLLVSLKAPTLTPVLQHARDPAARRKAYIAGTSRCPENARRLNRVVALRAQIAGLLGFGSHAEGTLKGNMASSPDEVNAFLDRVVTRLKPKRDEDYASLLALKRSETPGADALDPWDTAYFGRQIRESKGIDEEALKPHFPASEVVPATIKALGEDLFGFTVRGPLDDAQLWHDDCELYEVAKDDIIVGHVALDLKSRDGKFGHQMVVPLRPALVNGAPNCCAVLGNMGDANGRLRFREVETLLHELGHVFHALAGAPKPSILGWAWPMVPWPGGVEMDMLEVPSMLTQQFVYAAAASETLSASTRPPRHRRVTGRPRRYAPAVLAKIARPHAETGASLPSKTIEALAENRHLLAGLGNARYIAMCRYDMAMHSLASAADVDACGLWQEIYRETAGFTEAPGTHFASTWYHMCIGYDAGYYSYLWSEVNAVDAYKQFGDELDAAAGRRFRECVLEPGAAAGGAAMMEAFLGRPFREDAYFERLGVPVSS
uniref:Peptidase M3A/M3B catalytic domain-containing protein n=1 Tax=Pelagomonas calceolata TaxID=35677 RepID=A0A7S3ZU04_9STRA